jgi:hypothetical protein
MPFSKLKTYNQVYDKKFRRGPKNDPYQNGNLPAILSPPKYGVVLRFQMSATSNSRVNINRIQIIMLKVFCLSATTGYAAWSSARIKKIVVVPPNALDTSGSVANNESDLIWAGVTSDNSGMSTVNNSTVPRAKVYVPPEGTAASFPTSLVTTSANQLSANAGDGAEVLFSLFATPGTYLDLYLTVVDIDLPSVLPVTTLSGLLLGSTFWLGLDNIAVAAAAHVWDPIGKRQFVP